jgi:hypothetical protein
LQELISENARRIGRVLGLRPPEDRLPGVPGRRMREAILAATHGRERDLYARLDRIRGDIRETHKLEYFTCLILLKNLCFLDPDTPAEQDVKRMLHESYHHCDRPSFKEELRDELLSRQRSSIPIVRRIASQIRNQEAVTEEEVQMLRDSRAFPDVRLSIARRLFNQRRVEHLPALIEYLIRAYRSGEDRDEQRESEELFRRLSEFGLKDAGVPLLRSYFQHFEDIEARGQLMRALSSFGEPLVPQLLELYRSGQHRRPLARILRQMISFGTVAAARGLCTIVVEMGGAELDYAAEQLHLAVRDLVDHGMEFGHTVTMRDYFEEAVQQLETRPDLTCQRLAQQIRELLVRETGLTADLVERCIGGSAPPADQERLRRGSKSAFELLTLVIQDSTRSLEQRCRAIGLLSQLQGQKKKQYTRDLLWRIFREAPEQEMRLNALRSFAQTAPNLPQEARDQLYQDYLNGSPALKEVIKRYWDRLFPGAPLPTV